MFRPGYVIIATALAIQPGLAGPIIDIGMDASHLFGAPIPVMGDPRPIKTRIQKPPKMKQSDMTLYIVTYDCPGRSADQIAQSMNGAAYKIVTRMQFSQQFVVEASSEAIESLKRNNCVKSIQRNSPAPPTAG